MSAEAINYGDDYPAGDVAVASDALWSGLPPAQAMNLPGAEADAGAITIHDAATIQVGREYRTLDPMESAMVSLLGRTRSMERRIRRQRYIGYVTTDTVVELAGMSDEDGALDRGMVLDTFSNLVRNKLVTAGGERLVASRAAQTGGGTGYRLKNRVVFENAPGRDSFGDDSEHKNRLVRQEAGRTALWLAVAPPPSGHAGQDGAQEGPAKPAPKPSEEEKRGLEWLHRAICRDEDPELFFPIGTGKAALMQTAEAKAVCRKCPVVAECLAWALESGQDAGVWGGMSEDERRALRRRNARARSRTT